VEGNSRLQGSESGAQVAGPGWVGCSPRLLCKVGTTPFGLLIPPTGPGWGRGWLLVGMIAGMVAGNVISGGFMQAYCPTRLMCRITTSIQVVNFRAIPIGAVLGGLLADAVGFQSALGDPVRFLHRVVADPAGGADPSRP
jgi:hypothetical protein